jgi:hypothetical protein
MAHFAKIGEDNFILAVDVVSDKNTASEAKGIEFLRKLTGYAHWKQTSKDTRHGVHGLGGTPFRKNYAEIGGTYDEGRDAFIARKIFPSWILNEETCDWEAPTPYPEDGNFYQWDESSLSWQILTEKEDPRAEPDPL